MQPLAGGGHHQLSVLDSLDADQFVGDPAHVAHLAANDEYFQAVVGVEMDVQRGDDLVVVGVLLLGKLVGEVADVVVVDERHRADSLLFLLLQLQLDLGCADQVPDRLGPVRVSFLLDQFVEVLEQLVVHRYAESYGFTHTGSPC
jgi:hypothetical protein